MIHFRKIIVFGLLIFVLSMFASPVTGAQNSWEGFWEGMQTALIRVETHPTLEYFNTLYDPAFANRDAVFGRMDARAAALTDIEVSFPIFIFEANRAAYQKVVTGTFTQPYVSGNTTLPPTNAPVRFVWQGIMDANGAGQITGDYSVNDGFATFQEWGAILLAPGQEHGQIGLEPHDPTLVELYGDTVEGQIGLPFAVFPSCIYFNHDLFDAAGLPYPPQDSDTPYVDADGNVRQWNWETMTELAKLLTVDANGNDATSPVFDPDSVVQCGFGQLNFSETPESRLVAAVHQDGWSAGYFTLTTQPGTDMFVDIFEQPLTSADAMQIPAFVFLHTNENNEIDLSYLNYDVLGITNRLQINPTTVTLVPIK